MRARRVRRDARRRLARPALPRARVAPTRVKTCGACSLYSAAAHGRPEAKDIEVEARQAPRAARDLRPARPGLPDLQAAEAAASRLPELQDVQGPGRRAAPPRRAVDTSRVIRVAVDALGGDRAPEEIVAGAARRAASSEIQPILFGPPGLDTARACRSSRRPRRSTMDDHAVEAVRSKPDSSLVRAVRAVADGDADAVVSAGNTGAMLAASLLHIRRLPGVHRPGDRRRHPDEARAAASSSTRARTRTPGPSTSSSSPTWAPSSPRRSSGSRESGGAAALDRRGGREGQPAHARGARAPARGGPPLRAGTPRGGRSSRGSADVVVADGFTGNVALKTLEGTIRTPARCAPRASSSASARGRLGGSLIRPGGAEAARAPRSRDVRRRLPARAQRARRDRARLELARRDRERHPARRARRRAPRGRAPAGATRRAACAGSRMSGRT